MDANVQVTRYAVSCLPEDHELYPHMSLTVEYRGDGLWAVIDQPYCLGSDGEWSYEMRPSERTDEWIKTHRFDEETAKRLAREAAPHMQVNGYTVTDVLKER